MANSADALMGSAVGGEPFPRAELIEDRRAAGKHLGVERMVEAVNTIGRRRGIGPSAAT